MRSPDSEDIREYQRVNGCGIMEAKKLLQRNMAEDAVYDAEVMWYKNMKDEAFEEMCHVVRFILNNMYRK